MPPDNLPSQTTPQNSNELKHKLWSIAMKNSIIVLIIMLILYIPVSILFLPIGLLALILSFIIFFIFFYLSSVFIETYPIVGKILSAIWITITTLSVLVLVGFIITFLGKMNKHNNYITT